MKRLGILFVISAPSGAGKSTICSSLRQTPDTFYAVSCTTRPPRAGEIDGYCMLIMQITDHPWFKPDWRDLYSK